MLVAVTATAIGFAVDAGSGHRELSAVFGICYALGCLAAVLAVRQSGVFTAVIQPPLILFVAVPGSYYLFHGGQLSGLRDLAINCVYPLIERFPLMLFTSAAVLLIGLARWYFDIATRRPAEGYKPRTRAPGTARAGFVSSITALFSGLALGKAVHRRRAATESAAGNLADAPPRRRRSAERPTRGKPAAAETRSGRRPTKRATPPRARPRRPVAAEPDDRVRAERTERPDRPRRPRPSRAPDPPLVPPAEPRRRVRTQPREPRKQPPSERRGSYDRPRHRFDDYQPFQDPFEGGFEPGLEPKSGHPSRSTHHPVSRVRYRGTDDEHRTRPRPTDGSQSRGRHSKHEG